MSTQQAPVGVVVTPPTAGGSPAWTAIAQYEGGLSSIWSEQQARAGAQLALRIQTLLDDHLARRTLLHQTASSCCEAVPVEPTARLLPEE